MISENTVPEPFWEWKQLHWFEWLLIITVLGMHLYTALSAPHNFSTRWFTRDDAYYYFKVAQNISEGRGSSFDGINPTNGYHPLWMLVCVPIFALARFDLILPLRVLMLVMAALSAATAIGLFRLLKKQTGEPIAMLAAAFWAFSPVVHSIVTQQGMETGLVALSVVVFLLALQRIETKKDLTSRDLIGLGLAGLFVLFSRLDGIYLLLLGGVWVVFRRSPLRYLLPIDLLVTFSVIIGAYIQRAGLKTYLLGFDSSALFMAALTFSIQTPVFYFSGLYTRPKSLPARQLLVMTLFGVTLSALLTALVAFSLDALGILALPRAVPALYWAGTLILTVLTRCAARLISPWPVALSKEMKPSLGFLTGKTGKNHFRLLLEPLTGWLRAALAYFGVAAAGLLAYMGLNRALFGTLMPVSGQIKRWWGSMPNNVYGGSSKSVLDVFGLDPNFSQAWNLLGKPLESLSAKLSGAEEFSRETYWIILAGILIIWLLLFLSNRRRNLRRAFLVGLLPLLISAQLHILGYSAMAYAAQHEWYWVLQMLTLVILAALGLAALLDLLPRGAVIQRAAWGASALLSLWLAWGLGFELVSRMPYTDTMAGQPYVDTLLILEGYTEPGALIGMTGGGNAGYFIHDRTVVNMDGLINSYVYFQALRENRGGEYLAGIGLDYIFANQYIITSSMPYRQQFTTDELIAVPGAPAYGQKELMRYVPLK